ncbi:DUF423 domain-containing protein [Paenibacillus sp. 598K]|uniref:DUF423 domain-containing protein n=1 Tax=Paenibacillus sp. 598K TaxID=1117987 RepID=UPI000FFA57F6|nr:DUF423 domain-containing protein [Paenibacillus sp. 598K]GBF72914.1 DUF423 domain-containing protein [Paenibacillus sp. 598K]
MQTLLLLGSFTMMAAVILGAFGAHALKKKLTPEMLAVYQTGVLYHLIHGLGILIVGLLSDGAAAGSLAIVAGWTMFAGILLFSGSLYVLSVTGIRRLGAITPLGGVAFIAGWALLAAAIIQS